MAISELKTVILRFRDLSVPNTIERHRTICERDGYVWWGWWSKPQEKVPTEEFATINNIISEKGELEIMLFDSGNKKLYTTTCVEVDFSNNGKEKESPDKQKTPDYYSSSCYLAWFKFSSISDPLPNGEALRRLRSLTYVRVDSFFRSGSSPFTPFYGKRIYSLDELADQQRTIWFVRDAKKGDRNHEIHSYSGSLNNDKNVDQDFFLLQSEDALWLSDIHFSTEGHHAFNNDKPGYDNRLQIRLHSELKKKEKNVSHIIISGDLTFCASKDEYAIAIKFINDMNSYYDLHDTNYSISPGNHDLKFKDTPYEATDPVTVTLDDAKENYVSFYNQLYGVDPTDSLFSIRRVLTPSLTPVEIISVNSCYLQQDEKHFRGMGCVGDIQMREIEEKLAMTKDKGVFRILSMHHHLLPVLYSEKPEISKMYSMTLDSEAISQFIIRNNIKMVLHGHTHTEFYSEVIRYKDSGASRTKHKYYVIGIGSAGAIELSENSPNMFGILTFGKDGLQISLYSLSPEGKASKEIVSYDIPYRESV